MKIYSKLESLLKNEVDYISDDGDLKKWVVINKAQNFDSDLIKILLQDSEIKDIFFQSINETLIFNHNLFVQFLEQKNYLNDSYTRYRNKVGLKTNDKFYKQSNEVVLAWPFKDCVLEGGQTHEEHKKEEIFFNNILAQDEITQLFEPKVLTNAKLLTKDSVKSFDTSSKDFFSHTNNYLIKGNNLLVAHSILKRYRGKVKLVYLDPPYNTPGEANTFSYNNTFNHSTWLTFMKNRIEIAKKLVSEDGFIVLAIDDVEFAYLKVLADEILGRENFLATVVVQIKKEGRTDSEFFATSHDYTLFYSKNRDKAKINELSISEENARKWKEEDDTGRYYWRDFMRTGGNSTPLDRPKQNFIIYFSPGKNQIIGVGGIGQNKPEDEYYSNTVFTISEDGDCVEINKSKFLEVNRDVEEHLPVGSSGERQVWRWSDREKVMWACQLGEINVINGKVKIKDRIREGSKPTTTWYDSDFNATSHGTLLVKKMFKGKKVFSYPKSLYTMIDIIKVTTNKDDLVVDLFGGSATTAHAVCRVNRSDNGNRKFIIVEQMDYVHKATLPRIRESLDSVTNSFVYFELKKYNEQFVERIANAKDSNELIEIWNEMKLKSFLNYNVDIKKQEENLDEFKELDLTLQKQHLFELLDKNQLYVNLSSLEDGDIQCTEDEKKATQDFYQI